MLYHALQGPDLENKVSCIYKCTVYRHAARSFHIYNFAVEKLQHIIEWRLVIMP